MIKIDFNSNSTKVYWAGILFTIVLFLLCRCLYIVHHSSATSIPPPASYGTEAASHTELRGRLNGEDWMASESKKRRARMASQRVKLTFEQLEARHLMSVSSPAPPMLEHMLDAPLLEQMDTSQPLDTNYTPMVYAGADMTVSIADGAVINGEVIANIPSSLSITWSLVSGPGSATFSDPGLPSTTVTFSLAGTYELELTAVNGGIAASNRVIVTVEGSVPEDVVVVTGTAITEKYEVDPAKDRAWDARGAEFLVESVTHGMISLEGDETETGMLWAGGYVESNKPWDATWLDHKDGNPGELTRNSTAIDMKGFDLTVSGLHFFNVHDGVRTNNAFDWQIQHVWGEYVRDDCVESDGWNSGQIVDSLFDGCYTGISTRPSSSHPEYDGTGEVLLIDRVLLRMEAMPYPYRWQTKSGNIDENGDPWDENSGDIPYRHGNLFKMEEEDPRNIHFIIRDSVFLMDHENLNSDDFDFPPEEFIDEMTNVTVIWLGEGEFPGYLPPGDITVVTGQAGLDLWTEKVTDWHDRHPDVGPTRKPSEPGTFVFPRMFPTPLVLGEMTMIGPSDTEWFATSQSAQNYVHELQTEVTRLEKRHQEMTTDINPRERAIERGQKREDKTLADIERLQGELGMEKGRLKSAYILAESLEDEISALKQ